MAPSSPTPGVRHRHPDFDADIIRSLENIPATAEIITEDNATGLYRRTHYLSPSLAASIPSWAQVSSWSAVPPLTPIAPICTLSSVMIGNPPANAIMPGTSASPGTMPPLRSCHRPVALYREWETG